MAVSLLKPPDGDFRSTNSRYTAVSEVKRKKLSRLYIKWTSLLIYRQIDIVSSELIKVMVSRRKEGRRAISVLWLY